MLGANGAGKSLFLRLKGGLLEPTSGIIISGAKEGNTATSKRETGVSCMALVFQKPVMLRRTVSENLAFVLRQRNIPANERSKEINKALLAARIKTKADLPARRLSGGEQQRLALARALITSPHALLLDEPTASLDPLSTSIVEDMILEAESTGTKIVLVTHDIKQAKRLADDILFIHEGRVLAHKPKREFFKDPGSIQAQAYLDGRVPEE